MAVWRRGEADDLLHHSEQGSQYTSGEFRRLLEANDITCSLSAACVTQDACLRHDGCACPAAHEPVRQRLGQLCHGKRSPFSRTGGVHGSLSSLKTERTARKVYRSRDHARADVFDYIECFYNPRRCHSKLGYLSPMAFEAQAMQT